MKTTDHRRSRRRGGGVRFLLCGACLSLSIAGTSARHPANAAPAPLGDSTSTKTVAIRAAIRNGEYATAERDARELLDQAERRHGATALEVAAVLDLLVKSLCSSRSQEITDVLMHAERSLRIKEQHLGSDAPGHVPTLINLGIVYRDLDRLTDARRVLERALRIQERSSGARSPDLGETLQALAAVLTEMGSYAEAKSVYERDLAIATTALGHEHRDVGQKLYNFARLLVRMGEYERARQEYEHALAIVTRNDGPEHVGVAYILNGLGTVLSDLGEFSAARLRFEGALRIARERLGELHTLTVSCVDHLGTLCCRLGDYEQARQHYEAALASCLQAHGPEHSRTALARAHLADLEFLEGRYARAIELNEETLPVLERTRGSDHPEVASRLWRYAQALECTGRYDEGNRALERALRIAERSLGTAHDDMGIYLAGLGSIALRRRQFEIARTRYQEALEICSARLPPEHPQLAPILRDLATTMQHLGFDSDAVALALRSETIAREHVRATIRGLPEREALGCWTVSAGGLGAALDVVAHGANAVERRQVFDAVIASRALVLDEIATRSALLNRTRDPKVVALSRGLVRANRELRRLILEGSELGDPIQQREQLARARATRDRAARALARKSAVFRGQQGREAIGLRQVAEALPSGCVLASFVEFQPEATGSASDQEARDRTSMAVFLLRAGETSPAVVDLGPATEISRLVSAWVGHMRREDATAEAEAECRRAGEALRRRIWDPLIPHLGGASGSSLVLVVPDGQVNLVNFAALPDGARKYLIDNGTRIHYLAAERDVVMKTAARRHGSGLVAVGGPDFDVALTPSPATAGSPEGAAMDTALRGARGDCAAFKDLRFERLPASAVEAERVRGLWAETKPGSPAALLTGPEANETNVKKLAPGSQVLHLATHGFFVGGPCSTVADDVRGTQGLAWDTELAPRGEDPLLYAGLAFSGANLRHAARTGEDDGILEAHEVAAMDLQGVGWAVLSACGTGLGEVRSGEGVFGLRRAFQTAGVRTVIMSLWSVKDRETQDWMTRLYTRRLRQRMDTASAVWAAGRDILEERRAAHRSTHPFYWAGFVAAGDWH